MKVCYDCPNPGNCLNASCVARSRTPPMSETELPKLEPCPFCGQPPRVTERPATPSERADSMCFISCMCGGLSARAHQIGRGSNPERAREDAIAAWNRRSPVAEGGGWRGQSAPSASDSYGLGWGERDGIVDRAARVAEGLAEAYEKWSERPDDTDAGKANVLRLAARHIRTIASPNKQAAAVAGEEQDNAKRCTPSPPVPSQEGASEGEGEEK